ncbi:MAG TPA: HTTM domain-containing protein [Polyangiaceae bacterium]|nr:HTTM domain-containing protein [Polyangiaceae bacterium]
MTGTEHTRAHLLERLNRPLPAEGLAVFRFLFGALMLGAVVRFSAKGWIDSLLIEPRYHFTYLGFSWVRPLPAPGMYALFTLMGLAALGIALGARTRSSALLFFLTFTYAELIDETTYLNHYYFVSLVAALLVILPSARVLSLDTWWRAGRSGVFEAATVPGWCYALLRCQVALVYLFAGFAKLNRDWLLHAEPLRTWLQAHVDLPLIGPWLGSATAAYAMSWAGAAFDLGVVPLLLWKRTRALAYAFACLFHVGIWLLFPIGVFSWVMLVAATIFFAPDWPRALRLPLRRARTAEPAAPRLTQLGLLLALGYVAIQVLVPLRFLLYPGNVNWTEEAFRFAWRVMLIEKTGSVEYRVAAGDRVFVVQPRAELTPVQYKMMSSQPDMVHQYALSLAERFEARGFHGVRVYADAWATLNGRHSQRLIDPSRDLAGYARNLFPKPFIVPLAEQAKAALERKAQR